MPATIWLLLMHIISTGLNQMLEASYAEAAPHTKAFPRPSAFYLVAAKAVAKDRQVKNASDEASDKAIIFERKNFISAFQNIID